MASFDTGVDIAVSSVLENILDDVVAIARSHQLDTFRSRFACGFAMSQMQRVIAWDQMTPDADSPSAKWEVEAKPEPILVDRFTRFEVKVKPRVKSLADLAGTGVGLKDTGTGRSRGPGSRTGTYVGRRGGGGG